MELMGRILHQTVWSLEALGLGFGLEFGGSEFRVASSMLQGMSWRTGVAVKIFGGGAREDCRHPFTESVRPLPS